MQSNRAICERRLLVTGASGFIGRALVAHAAGRGWMVRSALRVDQPIFGSDSRVVVSGIDGGTDWSEALEGRDAVVHLASLVHVLPEAGTETMTDFRRVNADGTERLARASAAAGVRRLVFVSTVKVLGEGRSQPYTDSDRPAPRDPYAQSKWEAELRLFEVAAETGLEVVILRPPLVYGPGVKANFLAMLEQVARGRALPLASVTARRSFCYVGNLIDAILLALEHPKAAGRTFLVGDGETVVLPEFIRMLGQALGKPARLYPMPVRLLTLAGRMLGRREAVDRLTQSLEVDISGIMRELDWRPFWTPAAGLMETAQWYLRRKGS